MPYNRPSVVVMTAALLCVATPGAQARSQRSDAAPKPPVFVAQAIVQSDAGFIITPVEPQGTPDAVGGPALIPLGGAVKIDRSLLNDTANGRAGSDAHL